MRMVGMRPFNSRTGLILNSLVLTVNKMAESHSGSRLTVFPTKRLLWPVNINL